MQEVLFVDVMIYKVREKGGFIYDMSLNPEVDFAILKKTRGIKFIEVITPEIPIELGEVVLKNIYGTSAIIGRLIPTHEYLINTVLKRLKIKRIERHIISERALPDIKDMAKVEEYITGRVISLRKLLDMKDRLNMCSGNVIDIVQALYCERRIRMVPAVKKVKGKNICSYCGKQPCDNCCPGFEYGDILLYAADNYNTGIPHKIDFKKVNMSEPCKRAYDDFMVFLKSRKDSAILWCAPNSFEYEVLSGGIADVIKSGGKVLYITAAFLIFKTIESYKEIIKGIWIENATDMVKGLKSVDIVVDSYSGYFSYYKAFDLVILDLRYSFIERPFENIELMCKKAVKEKGKFLMISCCPNREGRGIFKSSPEIISIPVSEAKNPIPEPRIILSRLVKGADAFIPPIAVDMIKWSLGEGSGVIIFVPDEAELNKVYYFLTSVEYIDRDMIDISTGRDKAPLMRLKKKQIQIVISADFKDAVSPIEDVNVVVMNSDDSIYKVDTLVNMASMALRYENKKFGEVIFVASQETDSISLAKSTIREINKIAWERGYIRR